MTELRSNWITWLADKCERDQALQITHRHGSMMPVGAHRGIDGRNHDPPRGLESEDVGDVRNRPHRAGDERDGQ